VAEESAAVPGRPYGVTAEEEDDDGRWPCWASTLFIVGSSLAFWALIIFALWWLFAG